jgi:hypothetical protein
MAWMVTFSGERVSSDRSHGRDSLVDLNSERKASEFDWPSADPPMILFQNIQTHLLHSTQYFHARVRLMGLISVDCSDSVVRSLPRVGSISCIMDDDLAGFRRLEQAIVFLMAASRIVARRSSLSISTTTRLIR